MDPDLVFVKGGKFVLGQDHPEWDKLPQFMRPPDSEKRQEDLADFFVGRFLVTFEQYDAFCEDTSTPKPSDEKWGRGNMPVMNVTWLEATRFCNWKSRKAGLKEAFSEDGKLIVLDKDGKKQFFDLGKRIDTSLLAKVEGYRFPLDSEWEYAAKGGAKSRNYKFIGGDIAAEVGWFKDNTRYSTKPIGEKKPNELGLYDMAGNVYEYCLDGTLQIRNVRGGGWSSQMQSMRASYKNGSRIDEKHTYVGFRLARSNVGQSPSDANSNGASSNSSNAQSIAPVETAQPANVASLPFRTV